MSHSVDYAARQDLIERIKARQGTLRCWCRTHRRYTGQHAPRVACESCWRYYIRLHP